MKRGDFSSAKQSFVSILRERPEELEVLHLLGTCEAKLGSLSSAAGLLQRALNIGGPNAVYLVALSIVLKDQGDLEAARRKCREGIDLQRDLASAHSALGLIDYELGAYGEAVESFRRFLGLRPDHPAGLHYLGITYNAMGRYAEATTYFQRLVALQPRNAQAHNALGAVLHAQQRLDEALVCYETASELQPGIAESHSNVARLHADRGDFPAAKSSFKLALEGDPRHQPSLAGLAILLEKSGAVTEGLKLLEPMISSGQGSDEMAIAYARLLRRQDKQSEAIAVLAAIDSRHAMLSDRIDKHALLGDLYDEGGDYSKAFDHYHRCNELKPQTFEQDRFRATVDEQIGFFSRDRMARLGRAKPKRCRPVFIVGMPRSGTSLVEQILGSHSMIHAGGERTQIYDFADHAGAILESRTDYPGCLEEAGPDGLGRLTNNYMADLADIVLDVGLFTDKLPGNFLHLGLIELLFPNAVVLHCRREPLDTAVSCYFQNFLRLELSFTNNLLHIGEYYTEYERMMAHWKSALSIPLMDLRYEDLVAEPESTMRRLTEFLGISWEPACLRFYEQERLVNTASYDQVRKPIYAHSVGRSAHYGQFLAPLKKALGGLG